MSTWIKENKPIATIIGIGTVAFIALGTVGVMKMLDEQAMTQQFIAAQSDWETAAGKPQSPTAETVKERAKDLKQLEASLGKIKESYSSFVPSEEALTPMEPEQFRLKLQNKVKAFKTAAQEKKIKVGDSFFLGFEPYSSSLARKEATGLLNYQLEGMDWLFNQALNSDITDVKRVYREPLAEEKAPVEAKDEKGRPVKTQAVKKDPVLRSAVTLKGKRQSVAKFINALNAGDKHLFVIRGMRVKNDKTGALTIAPPKPISGAKDTAPAGGEINFDSPATTTATGEPVKEEVVVEQILTPVLGNEEVEFHLVVDQILLPSAQAEKAPSVRTK